MRIFNAESPLMEGLSKVADLVILNLLVLLCCIPVITAGAALTGMHYVLLKMARDEEGYIVRSYFKSFKENFLQATGMWLIFLVLLSVFILDLRLTGGAAPAWLATGMAGARLAPCGDRDRPRAVDAAGPEGTRPCLVRRKPVAAGRGRALPACRGRDDLGWLDQGLSAARGGHSPQTRFSGPVSAGPFQRGRDCPCRLLSLPRRRFERRLPGSFPRRPGPAGRLRATDPAPVWPAVFGLRR